MLVSVRYLSYIDYIQSTSETDQRKVLNHLEKHLKALESLATRNPKEYVEKHDVWFIGEVIKFLNRIGVSRNDDSDLYIGMVLKIVLGRLKLI